MRVVPFARRYENGTVLWSISTVLRYRTLEIGCEAEHLSAMQNLENWLWELCDSGRLGCAEVQESVKIVNAATSIELWSCGRC